MEYMSYDRYIIVDKIYIICELRLIFIHIYITLVRLAILSTKKSKLKKLHHCLYKCM